MPFRLDTLVDLPRYARRETCKTVLDDKSGYDHLLLSAESRTFFGIQWGGWYYVYNTLPFGWKISPYVYHSVGLTATNFVRSIGVPCSLYIDDRHNGQVQVSHAAAAYSTLKTQDECNFATAGGNLLGCILSHSPRIFPGAEKIYLVPAKGGSIFGILVGLFTCSIPPSTREEREIITSNS